MSYFVPVSTAVRDAFLGEDATAKFVRVVIDPAGTPVTFVPIDLSCDASEEYQKWSFTLKNRAGLSVGLYANEPCVVQVSHNNSDWVTSFTGFVSDDGFSRIRGALVDDYVSLELVDATKRKGTKRKPSPAILSNFKTANLANTATSILHYLASQMGALVETSDITQTHELIEIGKKTVWAELQSLRDAFHADMYFRFDGKLLFRSPLEDAYSAPASEWTFQGDPSEAVTGNACRIVGKLSEAFLAVRCNYAKTSFVDYEQLTSRVIYKHTHNIDEASGYITVEIAPNSYWPGPHAGDVAKLKFADPESGEDYPFAVSVVTPAIGAYGSGSAIEATGGNLTLVSFNGSTSATSHEAGAAQIILYNNSSSTCTLRKLTITGEPYRKESDVKVEHVDASVSDAIDYVEQSVDGSYMVSSTQAFDTLYHIVEEGKGRPRRFGFSAPFMPWIQRRAIVMVQPPGESVVRCRIDTYSHKKSGRTLQGMRTAITCTELGTHVPSGSPSTVTIPTPSPSSPPMPSLSVRPSSNVIIINNRNGLTTAVISFTLSASAIDAANVTWAATDGTLTKVDDTQYTLDCSTVSGTSSTITVSASYNATVYQFATTVTKVYENLPVANLRGVTTVPTTTPDGDGLITGDYFLWAGATDATYTKGEIYEYNGTEWVESTNGDLVMTMFDSFADLANDVDSTVMGNVVIKNLVAIKAFIETLQSQLIEITTGGAIYSGYSADGLTPPASGSGFWFGASGKLKSYFAELLGTLRTGLNAPTDARVAIQDESGITSGPTFTGSGLNDLNITKEGDVAGNFRVKISGINNATNSGKEGYWATPFQVGTAIWIAIAVNSSGRFVAVGNDGYVSYSDDGITWTTPLKIGTYYWEGIAVNSSGRFVAVGNWSTISYSDDGITWATPFTVGDGNLYWNGIAVNSSGRFVAVGDDGYVSHSDDGITWATRFRLSYRNWYGVAVNSSGRFVAVGRYGYISYSDDGITWATPFTVGDVLWQSVAVNSSGRFVAVGNDGYVSYSDDGITWATPFKVGTVLWRSVAVNSAGRFVAVGYYGEVSYSNDGITWATPLKIGTYYWLGIAVNSAGKFVAVGAGGYITMSLLQDTIQISSNGGTTWGSDTLIPFYGAISITGFGIDISFGHTEGHTVGNYWSFTQGAMRGLVITDSAGDEYFSASNRVIKQNGMPAYACRAWVNFNGYSNEGGYCIIRGSENVSSVVDNGVGDYTVNFSVPMPDADYSAVVSSSQLLNTDTQEPTEGHGKPTTLTPSSCRVITMFHVQNIAHNMHDCELICLSIFR